MTTVRNLFRNKIRTMITLMGAATGIAILVSLTAVSDGFRSQIREVIESHSIDITVQSRGAANPYVSRVSLSDCERLKKVEGVRDLSSMIIGPLQSPLNPYLLVIGVSSMEALGTRLGILQGRMLNGNPSEVLLGQHVAGSGDYRANSKVALGEGEPFTVVGVYTSGSRMIDGAAVVAMDDARRLLKRDESVSMAFISLRRGSDPLGVTAEINRAFPHLNAVRSGDFVGQLRLIKVTDVAARTVSLIALLASCIVVMNTLLMSVAERTREIGILMAIGWSRFMIMRMVVLESVMICAAGGVLGNLLATIGLAAFQAINPEGLGAWVPVRASLEVVLVSVVVSLCLGIASALYPAFVATRLLPVQALRHE